MKEVKMGSYVRVLPYFFFWVLVFVLSTVLYKESNQRQTLNSQGRITQILYD